MQQRPHIARMDQVLRAHFANRPDVFGFRRRLPVRPAGQCPPFAEPRSPRVVWPRDSSRRDRRRGERVHHQRNRKAAGVRAGGGVGDHRASGRERSSGTPTPVSVSRNTGGSIAPAAATTLPRWRVTCWSTARTSRSQSTPATTASFGDTARRWSWSCTGTIAASASGTQRHKSTCQT